MTEARRGAALLESARAIAALVREDAAAIERAGRITERVLSELHERRLFRLLIPRTVGGEELPLCPALEIFEALARADGAVGWTVMIGAGAGWFGGFLERHAASEIFGAADAVVAGSGAPRGTARRVRGGYRVSGRWAYASGAHHAAWFTASCIVDDGVPAMTPTVRAVAVPANEATIHETWSVTGLRGTGSEDFEIRDRFVPESRTFSVLTDAPVEPGPLYRFPFLSLAELSFAAVSLGIARRALDEFAGLANAKRPMGSDELLAADADVKTRYARAEAAVRSSRAWLYASADEMWRAVCRGDTPSEHERALARLAAVDTAARCARAVDELRSRAGMTPLFASSPLGRAWRDAHAVTQNMAVAAGLYTDIGGLLIEPE
jgi:indole-3-acetate monooxygenase